MRFLKIRETPKQIALGMALGVFVGMSPFMGFHTITGVALAALFEWNKIAAGIAVFISNPVTAPFIYSMTYRLGAEITGFSDPAQLATLFKTDGLLALIKSPPVIIADLVIGGILLGIPAALIIYHLTFKIVYSARERLQNKPFRKLKSKFLTRPADPDPS